MYYEIASFASLFRQDIPTQSLRRNDIIAGFIQFCKGLLTTVWFCGELLSREIKFYQNICATGQLRQAENAGVVGKEIK
jgi:hypothetical protein